MSTIPGTFKKNIVILWLFGHFSTQILNYPIYLSKPTINLRNNVVLVLKNFSIVFQRLF